MTDGSSFVFKGKDLRLGNSKLFSIKISRRYPLPRSHPIGALDLACHGSFGVGLYYGADAADGIERYKSDGTLYMISRRVRVWYPDGENIGKTVRRNVCNRGLCCCVGSLCRDRYCACSLNPKRLLYSITQ